MIAKIVSNGSALRRQRRSDHPVRQDHERKATRAWLSPKVFQWWPYREFVEWLDERKWARAYDHLAHAEHLVRAEFRQDVILTLKRCIDQRLQHLKSTYQLDGIPFPKGPTCLLDKLNELGIVRPFMLQHLIEIRNRIEHEDARPPSRNRCGELVDVV